MAKNAALRAQGRQDEVVGRSKAQREAKRENWRKSIIERAETALAGTLVPGTVVDRIEAMKARHAAEVAEHKATMAAMQEHRAELVERHTATINALTLDKDHDYALLEDRFRTAVANERALNVALDEVVAIMKERGETIQRLETKLANL